MNPLSKLIREMYPKTYITPISVMWSVRQAVMGDHVPLENPPFDTIPKHPKVLWQRNSMAARR